ncbi:MAG: 3-oxoacyl-acyl-carrier protein [Planctomycetota bacterium]|nr:MAG: 3-oxoacyl-acyl-carrier protein [Planctomycetota bacterium]
MSSKPADRGAIVTGGASGIGAAVVTALERDGYLVCRVDLAEPADVLGDVRAEGTAQQALDWLRERGAGPETLVNCAGITRGAAMPKLSQEDWDLVIGVDLTGAFVFTKTVSSAMADRGGGRIVNVASTLALRARRGTAAYAAAKAGLLGFTRACARDLGPKNINVNAVAPGLVLTKLAEEIPQESRDRLLAETALGRFATPGDVAGVIAFLCSPAARHITGETIRVDGGQLA